MCSFHAAVTSGLATISLKAKISHEKSYAMPELEKVIIRVETLACFNGFYFIFFLFSLHIS